MYLRPLSPSQTSIYPLLASSHSYIYSATHYCTVVTTTMSSTHSNTFPSLCLGPDTTTPAQPDNPSGAVMRARRRTLFGAELPSSAVGNGFADMYSADGMTLTVRSLADVRCFLFPSTAE